MRRAVAAGRALLLALGLAACSSSTPSATETSASPSPTPTPTPSSVPWAGTVCVAFADVKASVAALGSNLSYDISSDRSALEQIDRQLRLQVLSVADSADRLNTALQGVPVDFVAANDMVTSLTKTGNDTKEAVEAVTSHLDAATSADNVLAAGAEVAQAVVAGKAAFTAGQAFVGAIGDATSTATGQLKEAFDAAPECQGQ